MKIEDFAFDLDSEQDVLQKIEMIKELHRSNAISTQKLEEYIRKQTCFTSVILQGACFDTLNDAQVNFVNANIDKPSF